MESRKELVVGSDTGAPCELALYRENGDYFLEAELGYPDPPKAMPVVRTTLASSMDQAVHRGMDQLKGILGPTVYSRALEALDRLIDNIYLRNIEISIEEVNNGNDYPNTIPVSEGVLITVSRPNGPDVRTYVALYSGCPFLGSPREIVRETLRFEGVARPTLVAKEVQKKWKKYVASK